MDARLNDCQIARITGIPRATVRDWRSGKRQNTHRYSKTQSSPHCARDHDFLTLPVREYCYLLGLYLGDGYIATHERGVHRIRIFTDSKYPGIIVECRQALEALMRGQAAHVLSRRDGCAEISMYSKHWPCLFPQHGRGRKHERHIKLNSWQECLVDQDTRSFIRGLIHSDGCRVVANDRGRASIRYFSNRSDDIKRIFCKRLDKLGVHWTRPCDRQIAIYSKASVAILDEFIGPKG